MLWLTLLLLFTVNPPTKPTKQKHAACECVKYCTPCAKPPSGDEPAP